VYDHDLPEFPFCIELYGDKLYVAEYKRNHGLAEEEHDAWMEKSLEVIMQVIKVEKENIFLKLRQRKPGRLGQYQKYDEEQHEFAVEENGLEFLVNLSDYLDTGLFLDHRLTRQRVREESAGKRVLNLFAYTGSFSVYAAAGGAAEVVTIDLSNTYLDWARKNFRLNGFTDPVKYQFIQADVLQWLSTIPAGHFDIIIMDPPTFSNSKRMKDFLDIQKDHVRMINQCLDGMRPGGTLYFSTNSRKFILEEEKIKTGNIKDITKATTPFDFENKLFRFCYQLDK
jgi:23S rRNA (cytosine1962-C5)-methyltransferase